MDSMTSWTGIKGNNWFDPENWTKGIPSANLHGYIPADPEGKCFPFITEKLCIDFTVKNDGKIDNEGLIAVKENGIFQNVGVIENHPTGTFVISGNVMNTGEILNAGTLDNNKVFTNSGNLQNEGLIDNENTLVNLGNWLNTGIVDNYGLITNSGKLENYNIIENKGAGKIENKGLIPEELINEFTPMKYTMSFVEDFSRQDSIS